MSYEQYREEYLQGTPATTGPDGFQESLITSAYISHLEAELVEAKLSRAAAEGAADGSRERANRLEAELAEVRDRSAAKIRSLEEELEEISEENQQLVADNIGYRDQIELLVVADNIGYREVKDSIQRQADQPALFSAWEADDETNR